MTGDKRKFLNLEKRKGEGFVAFGDKRKTLIKGVGKICKPNSAQLCDNDYKVKFEPNACLIKEASTRKALFSGIRERNLYRNCLESLPSQSCLVAFETD